MGTEYVEGEEVETPTTNHFGVGCVTGILISFVLWALLIIGVAQIIQVLR